MKRHQMINRKTVLSCLFLCAAVLQVDAQVLKPGLDKEILKTKQGSIVELPGFLTEKINQINYKKIVLPGPQFMISDDPEYIRVPEAIALKEPVVPGAVRLYIYNVNGVKDPVKIDRKIVALLKNTGSAPMHVRMIKYSSQKPSLNYFQIGKQGLYDYFTSNDENVIRTVAPGGSILIDEKLDKHIVKFDELVHGFYEFVIDQPGEISVVQAAPSASVSYMVNNIKNVVPIGHANAGRGTFGVSNYKVDNESVIDTKDGVVQLMVADGVKDPWVIGKEGHSGDEAKLAGNYGVMYDIELKWKSTDGKGLALVTWNSRSADNQWCGGMATSMVVSSGIFPGGVIQLPKDQLITKKSPEAVLVQIFKPGKTSEEQIIKLKYSPPGASCLPTPLIFVPIDLN
ncbi:copper amine oxidase [Pedobacter immunditicola]|uniref:copper amine oxidase n=1 Tax=Pedobacter immunditicola TaxID=3133440 RepID=UPI0030B7D374